LSVGVRSNSGGKRALVSEYLDLAVPNFDLRDH